MTGYTVHTGSTKKFSSGWDRIFSGSTPKAKQAKKKPATRTPAAAKKKSGRKK